MGSTRLPGKALAPMLGRPLLEVLLERVRRARRLKTVLVATTRLARDDAIADLAGRAGAACFRGDEQDVLARYYGAAEAAGAGVVVRLTADCPLLAPEVIDRVVEAFVAADGEVDMASNAPPKRRTYPDGMDVEAFSRAALERAHAQARSEADREHVTRYMYRCFRVLELHLSRPLGAVRLTVDEPADLERVREVLEELYPRDPAFTLDDVLQMLERRGELSPPA
jgi:spore coat polysaccharide biosynthesis protein SpsF